MTIIQWNCRGFRNNFDEIGLLAQRYNPQVICLQETHLKQTDDITMRQFNLISAFSPDPERAMGGASILVRQGVIHSRVPLTTNLQAVAVQLSLFKTITICSIYIPPSLKVQAQELADLVQQLPKPFLLLGDFNSHNPLWGRDHTNDKGKVLEDVISKNDICWFNDGTNTYLHPASGTYSSGSLW